MFLRNARSSPTSKTNTLFVEAYLKLKNMCIVSYKRSVIRHLYQKVANFIRIVLAKQFIFAEKLITVSANAFVDDIMT